jgi:hypothetical protein
VLALQNQLLRQLSGSKETRTTKEEAKDAMRVALEGRRILVVLDDVWGVDDTEAFLVDAFQARLLITTRNREVLVGLGAEQHSVDVLSPGEALRVLAEWTREKRPDRLPAEAAEVAKECGYLPLALAMIGAMVQLDSPSTAWQDALTRLRQADLAAIRRIFRGYTHPDLFVAIDVSVEALVVACI